MILELLFGLTISAQELECLALNTYHEARNQSLKGQHAIVSVVLNRAKSEQYPSEICDVVKQAKVDKKGNPIKHACQFSWFCDGAPDKPKEDYAFEQILENVKTAYVNWHMGNDVTRGATHYHLKKYNPSWSNNLKRVATIQDHVFYK